MARARCRGRSRPDIGFQSIDQRTRAEIAGRLETIGLGAVRKRFSPEFVNRIDVVVTYQPLDAEAIARILDHHIDELQRHVHTRLGDRSFEIEVSPAARDVLLSRGVSSEYGARELKRTIHRLLTQPLAALVASAQIAPGTRVIVDAADGGHAQPDAGRYPGVDDAAAADASRGCCCSTTTRRSSAGSRRCCAAPASRPSASGRRRRRGRKWRPGAPMSRCSMSSCPMATGVSLALELRGRDPRHADHPDDRHRALVRGSGACASVTTFPSAQAVSRPGRDQPDSGADGPPARSARRRAASRSLLARRSRRDPRAAGVWKNRRGSRGRASSSAAGTQFLRAATAPDMAKSTSWRATATRLCSSRSRRAATAEFGTAAEAVTARKQRRLVSMAADYLARNRLTDVPCRFDVVAIDGTGESAAITVYPNAFDA